MTVQAATPTAQGHAPGLIDFVLPARLEAGSPPEERGSGRDDVRLTVSWRSSAGVEHRRFTDLPEILENGDLLVVNTSATLPAALRGRVGDRAALLHLSVPAGPHAWAVELRHPQSDWRSSAPWLDARPGTVVVLPEGGRAVLMSPVRSGPALGDVRLWRARLELPQLLDRYLADNGRPVRYGYVSSDRPIAAYQTVFAEEAGSAEMPSAARPFTAELVTRLVSRGIGITPVLLHTGLSSQEAHEAPMEERFAVPGPSAARINATRRLGGRVIAVGTTVVRALETVVDPHGVVLPGAGRTGLVVAPDRPVRSVDGMITGWHEPRASHLAMIEAVAGRHLLEVSYAAALEEGYLWHEFGDSQLILP